MDRRERYEDPEEAMRILMESVAAGLWTCLPGIIQSFDTQKDTCTVQPAIQALLKKQDGSVTYVDLPILLDCPVIQIGGGGASLTFPLVKGDECLVVFADRCIDAWWDTGLVSQQAEVRMHDLSDGFVIPGIRSRPRFMSVSATTAQLRTDDGNAYLEVNPTTYEIKAQTTGKLTGNATGDIAVTSSGGKVTANAATEADVTAPVIKLTGNVTVTGNLTLTGGLSMTGGAGVTADLGAASMTTTGDVTAGGHSLKTHHHDTAGVQGGTSTLSSGGPLP